MSGGLASSSSGPLTWCDLGKKSLNLSAFHTLRIFKMANYYLTLLSLCGIVSTNFDGRCKSSLEPEEHCKGRNALHRFPSSFCFFFNCKGPTGACSLGGDKGGVSEDVPASRTESPEMQLRGAAEAGSAGRPSPSPRPPQLRPPC